MSNVTLNFARNLEKFLPTDEVKREAFSTQWYRDEKRPLQFVFHTDEIIIDGRIEISSPLKNYTIYKVGYVPTTMPIREEHDDYVVSDKAGLFPDPLVVAKGAYLHFAPHINHAFYLTFEDEVFAGEYEVKVTVFNKDAELASATARVLVEDTPLAEVDLTLFNWLHYDSIAEIHRVEPFSEEFYGVLSS